ncbi:MAG: YfhO family protein [Verrucomicrobia bacterium]|nr:YfhO family protein [Verrucomicrobiota bacterium]
MPEKPAPPPAENGPGSFVLLLIALSAVLAVQFHKSFAPDQMLFANDGPLGVMVAYRDDAVGNLAGVWQDLTWLGGQSPGGTLNLTTVLTAGLGPFTFMKFFTPFTQLLLGVCAWLFFRQLRFNPLVCVLGGIAAALNMDSFSRGCWGLGQWNITAAMTWLAMAALVVPGVKRAWLRAGVAGAAIGLGVSEGFDTGAIYSLYAAAFALALPWLLDGASEPAVRARRGIVSTVLMALFAGIVAAQTVHVLVTTQIKGVAGMEKQDAKQKQAIYDFATQWSLPKVETLRVIIPGLYGYRMLDHYTRDPGSVYWGTVGQQPGYETHRQGYPRHSGSGEYAGVLVVLVALWALAQAWRKDKGPFTPRERRFIWFWFGVAVVSLLLAWGRHAPFYKLFFSLPFASTIRNPIKFMHQFHLGLLVLFGFGLQGLWRLHLEAGAGAKDSIIEHVKLWWARVTGFDRHWVHASVAALVLAVLGWMFHVSSQAERIAWLKANGFDEKSVGGVPDIAAQIAKFSSNEVSWFIVFLILSAGLVAVMTSGALAGPRSKLAALLLGMLLITDLGRADAPWILYYNHRERYATNPVIDTLKARPWEHRVTALQQPMVFYSFYHQEWLQHHFPFYRVQSLDVAQEPRVPQEKMDYRGAFGQDALRYWQFTSTRWVLGVGLVPTERGPMNFLDVLNGQLDPVQKRFRLHTSFNLAQSRPDAPITTHVATNGQFALYEFTGALPRAALYSSWIATNRAAHLAFLTNAAFDPRAHVLVEEPFSAPAAGATGTNPPGGEVKFVSYAPKRITLAASAPGPRVLLLNDRHDPNWTVRVDGQPAPLLRCNYIMRGVALPAGEHTIEFRFEPPRQGLMLSMAGLVVALGLCALLLYDRRLAPASDTPAPPPAPTQPKPGK